MSDANDPDQTPYLRIVRGHPTEAELAALVVALQTLGAAPTPPAAPASAGPSGWAAYWRGHRQDLQPGPGVWRHSLRG